MKKLGTLLDTHAWIWLVCNERQRRTSARGRRSTTPRGPARWRVSEIWFWEIATKAVKGKPELDCDVVVWLRDAARTPGVGVVEVERETLVRSALLEMHADPADRILAATALRYGLRLATADRALLEYAERNRLLRVLDMRP